MAAVSCYHIYTFQLFFTTTLILPEFFVPKILILAKSVGVEFPHAEVSIINATVDWSKTSYLSRYGTHYFCLATVLLIHTQHCWVCINDAGPELILLRTADSRWRRPFVISIWFHGRVVLFCKCFEFFSQWSPSQNNAQKLYHRRLDSYFSIEVSMFFLLSFPISFE